MALVFLVAVNWVVLGPIVDGSLLSGNRAGPIVGLAGLPLLITLEILLVVDVSRRGKVSPFLEGFQVFGWVALAAFGASCTWPNFWHWVINRLGELLFAAGWFHHTPPYSDGESALRAGLVLSILVIPPWTMAIAGGYLVRGLRSRTQREFLTPHSTHRGLIA
jgi:hypothetical protein